MSFRNSVTIVASPRSRVCKTFLARLLTDFHLPEGRSVEAFDLTARTLALLGHVTRSTVHFRFSAAVGRNIGLTLINNLGGLPCLTI